MRVSFLHGSILATLLWLAGCSSDGPPLPPVNEPEELANPLASFSLQIWTDHTPWLIDSLVDLKLRASVPVYLSLYAIHSSGRTSRLLNDRRVIGNRTLLYPEPHIPLDLRLSPPVGTEIFILVGTQVPLNWPPSKPQPTLKSPPMVPLEMSRQELLAGLQAAFLERDRRQWNTAVLRVPLEPRIVSSE